MDRGGERVIDALVVFTLIVAFAWTIGLLDWWGRRRERSRH